MAARSSVTCLNGTQRGARTEPLRLIGHSNVTRSLPKLLGGDTWPGDWRGACGERKWSRGFSTSCGEVFSLPVGFSVGAADHVSDGALGPTLYQG